MEEFKPGCQRPAIQKRQVQENGSKEEVVVKEER